MDSDHQSPKIENALVMGHWDVGHDLMILLSASWMVPLVNLFQPFSSHMGINLCR